MSEFLASYLAYARDVLLYFLDPGQRVFYLYIATSVLAAYGVYLFQRKQSRNAAEGSFLAFLFPKSVWSHPSAWLDVRYFFFHKLLAHFLLLGLFAGTAALVFRWITGHAITSLPVTAEGAAGWGIVIGYMLVSTIVLDLIGYTVHYLQHKVPILWEFHKVHHSAEVMHPLSNYREHPVDNFFYLLLIGAGYGAVAGGVYQYAAVVPSVPSILGVPILMFVFNILAYNLRHSHVWLRWPGIWSKVFPSPAHHHVHHSCHPDHFDKNFAFMFPVWDVIFGTYEMPEDNRDVKFGVAGMKSMEMDTCWKLYSIPFVKAARRLKRSGKTAGSSSRTDAG